MTDRKPRIFIASASEGLDVANAVRDALKASICCDPRVWNESTFKLSKTFIESLETELALSDFAVLTLTADDRLVSRRHMRMVHAIMSCSNLGCSWDA
jgi:predicted nucleotide-binding protein